MVWALLLASCGGSITEKPVNFDSSTDENIQSYMETDQLCPFEQIKIAEDEFQLSCVAPNSIFASYESNRRCPSKQCTIPTSKTTIACVDKGTVVDFIGKHGFNERNSQVCMSDGQFTYVESVSESGLALDSIDCVEERNHSLGEVFDQSDESLICSSLGVHIATICAISDNFDGEHCSRSGCKYPIYAFNHDQEQCLPGGMWSDNL